MPTFTGKERQPSAWWLLLLLVPFGVVLSGPVSDHADPAMWGIPVAVWFQALWVFAAALTVGLLYAGLSPRPVPIRGRKRAR
ncbi:DUF3311 domain-containing protein [Vineibacter terrae]|uniref:DUF3311 domain-containing protein n=1 Tax=Vineibacter terrae TaxID=2586908 RepID=UPI002E34320D|nr:DUF3311 domain-containing protein [Vineibacter terrae]HEX2885619.1 DUF3311 domain-containing protein [Vineibacter terrae]